MSGRIFTSMVTIGNVDIYQVNANPDGTLPAREGSLAVRSDAGNTAIYQNTDGAMAWSQLPTSPAVMTFTFEIQIQPPPGGAGTSRPWRMPVNGIVRGWYRRSTGTQPSSDGTYGIIVRRQPAGSFATNVGATILSTPFNANEWVVIEDPFASPMAAPFNAGDDLFIEILNDDPGLIGSGTLYVQLDVTQI